MLAAPSPACHAISTTVNTIDVPSTTVGGQGAVN